MRGDVIVVAVGLVVALAFSMLITAFTTDIIYPIVAAAGGKTGNGLGFYVSDHNTKTFVDIGAFISAIIFFVIFMTVVYFVIVVPYKHVQPGLPVQRPARRRLQMQVLRHRPARHRLTLPHLDCPMAGKAGYSSLLSPTAGSGPPRPHRPRPVTNR
jgi:large-conductance mechanosensitive channel